MIIIIISGSKCINYQYTIIINLIDHYSNEGNVLIIIITCDIIHTVRIVENV